MCTRYYYIFAFQLCVAGYSVQCVVEETHSNISIISPRQLAANKQQDEMNSPTTASSLLVLGQPALSYSLLFFFLFFFPFLYVVGPPSHPHKTHSRRDRNTMSFLISPSSNGRLEQLSKLSRETRAGGWTSRWKKKWHITSMWDESAALKVATPFSLDHKSLIDISNSINQDGLTPKHISNNVSFLSFLFFSFFLRLPYMV